MENQALPIDKRLTWIDVARGFAIFGIFMVNLPAFHAPYFLYGNGQNYWGAGSSGGIQIFIDIFFQASFYSLFSILFGFGMQIIIENLSKKNLNSQKYLLRRLFVLLGFGLIHALFIWHGDILFTYSLIGFWLLLFIKRKNKTLIAWGLSLLLAPTLLYTLLLYLVRDYSDAINQTAIDAAMFNYGKGSFSDVLSQNISDWFFVTNPFTLILISMNLLPLFLFGMLIARKKWLHDIHEHQRFLKRAWIVSLVLFLLIKAGPYLIGNPMWLTVLQDFIGGAVSAIFYLVTITLSYPKMKKLFYPLQYVGRMALSNYILQSLLGVFIFYGIGLGFYGKLSPAETISIDRLSTSNRVK